MLDGWAIVPQGAHIPVSTIRSSKLDEPWQLYPLALPLLVQSLHLARLFWHGRCICKNGCMR
jgi:hypothetical protein